MGCKGKKPKKMAFGGALDMLGNVVGSLWGGQQGPTAGIGYGSPVRRPLVTGGSPVSTMPIGRDPMKLGPGNIGTKLRNAKMRSAGLGGAGLAAFSTLYSRGGKVPGKAKVRGDSTRNDKVKALLSPGEIVVPRSKAGSKAEAKDFVDRVFDMDKHGNKTYRQDGKKYAAGGRVKLPPQAEGPGMSTKDMNESMMPWIEEYSKKYGPTPTPTPKPKKMACGGRVKRGKK